MKQEPIPGKPCASLKLVTRDYTKIYDKYITLGPNIVNNYNYKVDDQYDYLKDMNGIAN